MDADGRHRREIRGRYPEATDAVYQATWSRDGRRIYFVVGDTKDVLGTYAIAPDESRIAVHGVMRPGAARDILVFRPGEEARRLTSTPGADEYAEWSPDGSRSAFVSNRDGNAKIYVMNADGSDQTNVARNPAPDTFPVWVPARRSR